MNLFSVVCAVATIVAVYWLARRVGSTGIGAVAGAMTLASGTAFWFYAGFAKHYALSGLLLVAAILLVLRWVDDGGPALLATAGVALGLAAGASWQLTALTAVALGVVIFLGGRRPTLVDLAAPIVAGLVVIGLLAAFVLIRAGQDPALNWGRATTPDRLRDLVLMKDFGLNVSPDAGGGNPGRQTVTGRDVSRAPLRALAYVFLLVREFSRLALLVAVIGAAAMWRRKGRRAVAAFFTVLFLLNLLAAGIVVGVGLPARFSDALAHGGFLAGATTTLAVWVALGVSAIERGVAGFSDGTRSRRDRASRRRAERKGDRIAPVPVGAATIAACLLGALVVLPAVFAHLPVVQHRQPAYAEQYARNVLGQLPQRAVLLVWGAERTFPLIEAQVVDGVRPDVDVVNANGLDRSWYREVLQDQLGRSIDVDGEKGAERAADFISVVSDRPVFLDAVAMRLLRDTVRFTPVGVVGEVRRGGAAPPDLATGERLMASTYELDGVYDDGARVVDSRIGTSSSATSRRISSSLGGTCRRMTRRVRDATSSSPCGSTPPMSRCGSSSTTSMAAAPPEPETASGRLGAPRHRS